MKVLTITDIKSMLKLIGFDNFCLRLIGYLEDDFKKWEKFSKMPRPANYFPEGVIELMPSTDGELYSYKYVNGHPYNPKKGKLTVMATGQLSLVETGEPLLFSEMNILTAIRTACTSAMAGKYLARKNSSSIAIIGTGAQSEFQALAFKTQFPITDIYYYDIDSEAMEKFSYNLNDIGVNLHPCQSVEETVEKADIIATMTADKKRTNILNNKIVKGGVFINALGGDSTGKTELEEDLIKRAKVVVEYKQQTLIEGEVQYLGEGAIYAELHEIISGKKQGRINNEEVIIFDSVGFAIEDFSILRLVYDIAQQHKIGKSLDMIPDLKNPKDLFSLLK